MAASLTTVPGGTVDFSDEQLVELGMLFRGPIIGPGDPATTRSGSSRISRSIAGRASSSGARAKPTSSTASTWLGSTGCCSRFGPVGTTSPVTAPSMVVWCSTCGT